jgi:hypothetical protein
VLEYRTSDGKGGFLTLPARLYCSRTLAAARAALCDASVFPAEDSAGPFPAAFMPAARKLWSRLLRVHLHSMLEHECAVDPLVRAAFSHFFTFGKVHGLFAAEELPPLVAARVSAACAGT